MNLSQYAYNLLSNGLFLALFLPAFGYTRFTGRYRNVFRQRMGCYRPDLIKHMPGRPRIWFHGASVGEVKAAIPIMTSLKNRLPNCGLILSTFTGHGLNSARSMISGHKQLSNVPCLLAPVDVTTAVRKALSTLKPEVLVCLETELWPNWLMESQRAGVKTVLVNGRISDRTIKKYLKIKSLMQAVIGRMEAFSMVAEVDARRIQLLGAPGRKVTVNGNAKFDLRPLPDTALKVRLQSLYNLNGKEPVWVAGSTRGNENEIILNAYLRVIRTVPQAVLILAPRHIAKTRQLEAIVKAKGLAYQLHTDLKRPGARRTAPVVVMDTIGELQETYGVASVVFCGGSLVPLGGQNILEPAAWGKPVLFGPSMGDFQDAKQLLVQSGGGIEVQDESELAAKVAYFLSQPQEARRAGDQAHAAILANQGAAQKHAEVILKLIL